MNKTLLFTAFLLFFEGEMAAQLSGFYRDEPTGRFGLSDLETGEPMTAPIFGAIFQMEGTDSLFTAKTETGFGIFGTSGREVVPPVYDDIYFDRTGAESMGFVTVLKDGLKGLFALPEGKNILPVEFDAVGAVTDKLVFSRRVGAETLDFYNENGIKRFQISGKMAYSCASAGDFNVLKNDDSMARFSDGGQDFSSGAQRVSTRAWIFQSLTKNGEPKAAALLNEAGDTLVKGAFEIRKVAVVRFVVGIKTDGIARFGLCDDAGKWLIQPSEKTIRSLGKPLAFDNALVLSDRQGNEQVWSKNGELLLDSCRVGAPTSDKALLRWAKKSAANWVFTASKNGKNGTLGLFQLNGKQILQQEFTAIYCASENHHFVAAHRAPQGGFGVNAYDHNTGQKLFDEDFENLLYTTDPQVFWAKKNDAWALVNYLTYNRLQPKFEIATINRLPSMCFEIYEKGSRKVVDPTGAVLLATSLEYIATTKRRHFEQFFEQTGRRGHLVAVETRRSDPEGAWRAIGAGGERYFFDSETPKPKPKPAQDGPKEALAEATDVAVPEPPPQPTDEVMTIVEKRPEFPGGNAAMLSFLAKNLRYPAEATKNGTEGRVILNFVV